MRVFDWPPIVDDDANSFHPFNDSFECARNWPNEGTAEAMSRMRTMTTVFLFIMRYLSVMKVSRDGWVMRFSNEILEKQESVKLFIKSSCPIWHKAFLIAPAPREACSFSAGS